MKTILKETGLRNIKALADRYKKAKIYFHQDLDGVTTALAMKNYLENNGIEVVDAEIIQYGDKEFAVKKLDAQGDTMPVLVDFAHGKPMFVVHTDHHDSQSGVEKDTSTSFRPSRSNVATLSQVMSPTDIFPNEDVTLISTVDSADFARFGLQPEDIMNFVFKLQKDKGLQSNKMALGLATNKLLLAFKNKPGFLEELVMTSQPSLLNIFQNINRIADRENLNFDERVAQGKAFNKWGRPEKKPYASPEEMDANQKDYIQKQKDSDKVYYDDGIIVQYGGGSMFKPGSYDRYTPFKNYPEADFLVIAWPMGLVQASCNPFKGERELKGVNLGEIAQEVLSKWEPQLKDKIIPLSTIKWVSESGKDFDEDSVGFTNADLEAFYGDKVRSIDGGEEYMDRLKNIMNKPSSELTDNEWKILDKLGVPAWEMIQANSGGHKCITNISAINYFGRSMRPPNPDRPRGPKKEEDSPSVQFVKMVQKRFVEILKEKINSSKNINESFNKESKKKKYFVDKSKIHGEGVFANKNLNKNETIGLLHTINGSNYNFTELGKLHNHSDEPNCHNELINNQRFLVASKPINIGEELTTNYRLQPDLEQPEDWGINESEKKEMKPEIDGYRTYSPFKDLDYIIVNGDGIDCDNIVYDLILVGNNGLVKYCRKNSGSYFLDNTSKVLELPLKNGENGEDLFKDKEKLKSWILNKIESVDKDFKIRKSFFN